MSSIKYRTISVNDFGAVGDGRIDDAPAIQRAIDSLNDEPDQWGATNAGGVLLFPPGRYRTRSTINILTPNLTLQGCQLPSITHRTCCIISQMDEPVFRFPPDSTQAPTPFAMRDISMMSVNGEPVYASCGVEIWTGTGKQFRRGFTFENVGIYYKNHGIKVCRLPRDAYQIGDMRINDCAINLNTIGIETYPEVSINLLSIRDSQVRQNREQGADLRAYGASIDNVCWEGQPRGLKLYAEGAVLSANFSEHNSDYMFDLCGKDIVEQGSYYFQMSEKSQKIRKCVGSA